MPAVATPRVLAALSHRRSISLTSEASVLSGVSAASNTARAFLVSEGPPVVAVRAAPDGSATAVQVGPLLCVK